MFTILGRSPDRATFCDRVTRRNFLTVGSVAYGGLTLPTLLRAETQGLLRAETQGIAASPHKSLIHVFLPGGPPHQDMWDLKPDAPAEVRGEFQPIDTNVTGIQIGELFPKLATMMDRLVILRSIVGARGPHYATQCMTGRTGPSSGPGSHPNIGAWVSRIKGSAHPSVPSNLSLFYRTRHGPWGNPSGAGFLGDAHAPHGLVDYVDPGKKVKHADDVRPRPKDLVLQKISLEQMQDRRRLLQSFDTWRRAIVDSHQLGARDVFTDRALSILTTSRLMDAFDISREDPKIVERYGSSIPQHLADSAPRMTTNFLIARRLIEAGARVVSLNFGRWDWHGSNFVQGRREMPMIDNAVSALLTDLRERGLEQDVTVIVWGEFGRTPKINKGAGRDHWPRVNSALLAGGGMRTGQVIGSTDAQAGEVVDRPVTFGEVHATLYHCLGIDPHTPIRDAQGRPHYPVDLSLNPIPEII